MIVVEAAAPQVAPIRGDQRLMRVADATIDVGHDDALPGVPPIPDLVSKHVLEVGLDRHQRRARSHVHRLVEHRLTPSAQRRNLREGSRQHVGRAQAGALDHDHVVDPEGPVRHPLSFQVGAHPLLGSVSRLLQRSDHETPARLPVESGGGGEIRCLTKVDEVAGGAFVLKLSLERGLDLRRDRCRRKSRRSTGGRHAQEQGNDQDNVAETQSMVHLRVLLR